MTPSGRANTLFTVFLVSLHVRDYEVGGASHLYNPELVRQLCREIAAERDLERVLDLISFLQAVVREDQEEIRVRLAFLAKHYPLGSTDAKAAD